MLLRLLTKRQSPRAVDVDSKYAKQSGGRGQYGHCKVKFEPMDANGEETVQVRVHSCWWCYSEGIHPGSWRRYRRGYEGWYPWRIPGSWYMLTYTMVLTMKSTLLRWHSTLQVLLHSRMLCRKQLRFFLSLS